MGRLSRQDRVGVPPFGHRREAHVEDRYHLVDLARRIHVTAIRGDHASHLQRNVWVETVEPHRTDLNRARSLETARGFRVEGRALILGGAPFVVEDRRHHHK